MSDAVCIGKFDALHRGHRALADAARTLGRPLLLRLAGQAEALGWTPRLPLVAEADRQRILASWEVREADIPFAEVRHLDPAGFMAVLAHRFAPTALVVGADFRGGPGRSADAQAFAAAAVARGWQAVVVPLLPDADGPISSSRIRTLLATGDVAGAAALLGRPHRLAGPVVRGDGRGRSIGIPTANVAVNGVQLPANGVYAAWAHLDGVRYRAVLNLGTVPTAGAGRAQTCEAHLLEFAGDCYDRTLALDLVVRLRDERRFPSFADLVTQIRADIAAADAYLGK